MTKINTDNRIDFIHVSHQPETRTIVSSITRRDLNEVSVPIGTVMLARFNTGTTCIDLRFSKGINGRDETTGVAPDPRDRERLRLAYKNEGRAFNDTFNL